MGRKLFSLRIKPFRNPKPSSSPNFPFKPHIKKLVYEVCEIIRTNDQWEETLETRLSEEEVVPSDIAHFVFDRIRDVELGLKFYDWVSQRPYGCPLDGFAYSSLLKLLAKSRVFPEIETVLDSMKIEEKSPTREALDAIIRAYSDSGLVDKALELYSLAVKTYNFVPIVFACNSLLNALIKDGRTEIARRIYDEMVERDDGSENGCVDNYSTCIMVRGLCNEGKVEEGRKLIEDMWGKGCIPNVVFYNTLIDGYCKKGDVERAYGIFKELKLKGFLPAVETYGAIINGFCKEGNFEAIDRLLMEMNARGLRVNVQVYNIIIDAQYRHGCMVKAVETIRKMIENGCDPDIVTYNTFIYGLCRDGKVQEAEQLLEQATRRGLMPNKFSYTPVIHVYCRHGEHVRASDMLIEMTERGYKPDVVTYGALVHGLVAAGEVDVALTIRDKMVERGVLPDSGIYNVLMSGLCKKGNLPAAKQLLAEMLDQNVLPDAFIYATLVDGMIRNGDLDKAKKLFELTIEKGMDPGVVGYNTMIKGYCKSGMMNDAVSCINRMIKKYISPDEFTYSTIIDGYVKQHDMDGALTMFSQMEGKLTKAASFFEQMLMSKCIPNDVTFHYLINGFSNHALSEICTKGNETREHEKCMFLDLFRRMIVDGWVPRLAAYNSIIVCLCLYGMLKTTLQLSDKMVRKGYLSDSVTFAAQLHGVCLEGRSKEWKSIISCNLNEPELYVAEKYSLILDHYLPQGVISEASQILHMLVEDYKSHNQGVTNLKVSAS
ncbi:hypothetical protein F0562_023054 [Nyssa sinensis]|uniref:Pentacotripeptide-repeat region of PRORP domain-containing protein n=1 Tax=Nyssa sinensis TaxID=561372 RepID=A0A5J5BJH7_9ASTE|nr:hypothetical protein F0562_023054 [Nyssa sinensis]